jgi:hypothetical protein
LLKGEFHLDEVMGRPPMDVATMVGQAIEGLK